MSTDNDENPSIVLWNYIFENCGCQYIKAERAYSAFITALRPRVINIYMSTGMMLWIPNYLELPNFDTWLIIKFSLPPIITKTSETSFHWELPVIDYSKI